jgi:hypothetical protein
VLSPVDVLDADEPDEVRVRLVVVEGQLGDPPDGVDRVEAVHVQSRLRGADLLVDALQHGDVELLLAAEVVVDHPLGRADLGGDLVHAGAVVAAVGELTGGDVEDLGARAHGVPLRCCDRHLDHCSLPRPRGISN